MSGVSPSFEQLVSVRQAVDRVAATRIGSGYACAVITSEDPASAEVVVMAAGDDALARARALLGELTNTTRAAVRAVSPRLRRSELRRIRKQLEATLPRAGSIGPFGMESPIGTSRCPRVHIRLVPEANDPGALRWAEDAQDRFGADRVHITHDGSIAIAD